MSKLGSTRTWKDEEFRRSLSEKVFASLPTPPVGIFGLNGESLDDLIAQGGNTLIVDTCLLNTGDTTFTNNNFR